ncbi:Pentatricopeptide repeat (PPR) superfamily protein [Tripterygium wilfordii]|uniref:Pentatricopeptide repeat (PPR) superfamily protein n=1 Tax=Tripterygium wilfordii TaxID=458696 RepID=A0A7J7DS66_TRIWF|nr:pentatricopeptide repeat-containing protein At5g15340, mitochondrial-like [Tripterygium wilfordii]XP_038699312.1 pentatricopeptide repeat-containing protein At5g15340, mitochondrial-like [Tripterygium wilfordii]KAF5748976.1 Pentatricopeptide repeat (PPR) superfamily protein [Tripterygium wilfordii]
MKCPVQLDLLSFTTRHFRSLLRTASLSTGKKLHAVVITSGVGKDPNTSLPNAFLHFYASCGASRSAHNLFAQIPQTNREVADYTALITCLAREGRTKDAIFLFLEMRERVARIDEVAIVCFLGICSKLSDVVMGRQGHGCLVKMGFGGCVKVCNAVMDMYGKCGLMDELRRVFEDMEEKSVVTWTVLLNGAMRCEGVESGRIVFDAMPEKNVVAWTIIIAGYVGNGFVREAFVFLCEMVLQQGLGLNYVSICSILSACAQSGDFAVGRWIHVYALKDVGNKMNVMVGTALVDMYAKCGKINMAQKVFDFMLQRNVVTWNTMLSGLAMHGQGSLVLDMFQRMIKEVEPDDLTFTAVLSACSHSGLVDQGWHYFYNLQSLYHITPKIEHYACMVDLLGRADCLDEAKALIKRMPMPPNEVVIGSLLGSCNVHGKLELGECILQELVEIDPYNTEYHILVSNIYALAGKQDKSNALRQVLKNRGMRKIPGISSIHVNGQLHQFSAGNKSHPRTQEIYLLLDDMIRRLRLAGYVPNTSSQVISPSEFCQQP